MRIDEILDDTRPCFSFEFFPPKTDQGMENLWRAANELKQDTPAFVSVTYGAGGSTRDRTIQIVKRIKRELGLEAMAHFTCVGATTDELRKVLDEMRDAGIENVLALRGDPPQGQEEWRKTEGGLEYSTELIDLIARDYDFSIGAAAFPEVHIHSPSLDQDLRVMKEKVANGARFLITQLFFDNDLYFEFVEKARAAGVDVPIVPGIMPIQAFGQIKRITKMCGATIPPELEAELSARQDDEQAVRDFGVAYATLQCADLLARGAPGIHFYVLNRSPAARAVLAALRSARPWERALQPV
ncbi:MAG: methylenetetrahydrofolate reductase [Thermoleophilaceae bacterium]|nr:methylenetetrahydrofolate reductase [Thermoleophilaceae bacterium]